MKSLINIDDFCRLYYEEVSTLKEMSDYFNCSKSSIGSYRNRLGLPNREVFYPTIRSDNGKNSKTLFTKGMRAWNKGIKHLSLDNNPNWKGGTFINYQGYRMIRVTTEHPFTYRGYIREHRLVVEKQVGRVLEPDEHIHHIDGDKLNNNFDNLLIVSPSEHAKIHQPEGSLFGIHSH
jgi:uncharacterized protein (DUF1330 family)